MWFSYDGQGLTHFEGSVQRLDPIFGIYHLCLFEVCVGGGGSDWTEVCLNVPKEEQ